MSNPEDEPLGGKPVLPVPSPGAQRRAHPLFTRYLAESRSDPSAERSEEGQTDWAPTPHDEPTRVVRRSAVVAAPLAMSDDESPTRSQRAFPAMRFSSGRRYDDIIAFIQAMAGPLEQAVDPPPRGMDASDPDSGVSALPPAFAPYDDDEGTQVDDDELARLEELANPTAAELPHRPPPFAPMVRPSPPPRRGPESVDEASLASMVDTTMLIANPDGTAAFEIAFDDEVFQNLACSITVGPAGIIATFRAPDVNTRRLLEAEAGKLRVRLSERGLKVAEVRVESE
ncbi:MAG: hypothetical protein ACAI38_09965 [Myxococcota bacterium]